MPHCIIEYSKSLETRLKPDELITAVHRGALLSGLFEPSHIRARALAYESFIPGYDAGHFIHVTLRILSGRNTQQKKQLTGMVLGELEKLELSSISLTVEVTDIDSETYARQIL